MRGISLAPATILHAAVLTVLFLLQFVLPDYHHTNAARIMILASYAAGYNILMGYTGLLSLGHALFFAAGLYGAGLSAIYLSAPPPLAFLAGVLAGLVLSIAVGVLALRTSGVAFMIVTLMFAQAGYLASLYFSDVTRGDEGLVIGEAARRIGIGASALDLATPAARYNIALALLAAVLLGSLVLLRAPAGRVLVAIRENEERARLLGYDTFRYKLAAVALSGTISAAAGAVYALLFAYVGSTFASIQYSIYPLLWTLLGGAGTVLGPLLGAGLMFYLVDISSGFTSAYMLIVGATLVLVILWFPKGILGTLREARWPWLP